MSKIYIREVDETTVGNVVIDSTDIAYIPGFSTLTNVDEPKYGIPHVPVLCKTISEFETYFGSTTPTFSTNQPYPDGFDKDAIPTDIGGTPQYMFKKDDPDPSYIYAKELLAAGLPVLYERVNEVGEDISVNKMYEVLSTLFDKTSETNILSKVSIAAAYDSAASYNVGDYCNYNGVNYKCITAISDGEEWTPAHWQEDNTFDGFNIEVTSVYKFYNVFYDTGKYKFDYAKNSSATAVYSNSLKQKMAPLYSNTSSYEVGDHCTFNGNVFTCINAITEGEEFNVSNWTLSSNLTPEFIPTAFVTIDFDTWFSIHPLDNVSYTFTFDGNKWTDNQSNTYDTLINLGIKTAGNIASGDIITINNSYVLSWLCDGHSYNLTECGITVTPTLGTTLQEGDSFTIYLENQDALLLDRGMYSFKYLTTGGYPVFEYDSNSIAKLMAGLCYQRGDAVALIDHTDNPARTLTGSKSVYYKAKQTPYLLPTVYQSFAAMFTPSVEMTLINTYRGWSWTESARVKLPSTCVFPASFAYLSCLASSIKTYANWVAVAGATRGKVIGLVEPRTIKAITNAIADNYTSDIELAINPITNIKPYGQCIWGNRTLVDNSIKQGTTATSFLNIRNMVSDIKKQLFVACQSLLFEQNTDVLWVNFLSLITPVLDKMVSGFGISNYKIIKLPNSNKTKINVKIRIYPIYSVESFSITVYLNDEGVYIDGEE